MLITNEYRKLNRELHKRRKGYGCSGVQWALMTKRLIEQLKECGKDITILDYGCGKGALEVFFKGKGYEFQNYDPGVSQFDELPKPANIVVCADVLEHVEPECLDEVLGHLAGLTLFKALFVISLKPSSKILADGRNAHLLVQTKSWWGAKLSQHFRYYEVNNPKKDDWFIVVAKPLEAA